MVIWKARVVLRERCTYTRGKLPVYRVYASSRVRVELAEMVTGKELKVKDVESSWTAPGSASGLEGNRGRQGGRLI